MDRKPATSDLLLGLCVALGFVMVGVFAWQTAVQPEVVSVVLVDPVPGLSSLEELRRQAQAEVERDPIVYPEGPDTTWVVNPGSADLSGTLDGAGQPLSLSGAEGEPLAAPGGRPDSGPVDGQADNAALDAYLRDMDFALQSGAWWADSNGLAHQVLAEAMSGETASLGDLRQSTAAVKARVQQLTPPPEARAHHRQTLAVLDQGDALLAGFERAVQSGELEDMASSAAAAERLQASAAAVDELTEELKR